MRKYLLIKYINRETSLAEDREVYSWVTKNRQNQNYFAGLRNLFTISTMPTERVSKQKTIEATNKIFSKENRSRSSKLFLIRKHLIAASLASLLVIGSLVSLYLYKGDSFQSNQIVVNSGTDSLKMISLPDGSRLILANNSQVKYSESFGIKNRNIYAKGKVFFEIVNNKNLPMNVLTQSGVTISVLGTKFLLDDNDCLFSTILVTGKIKLEVPRKYPKKNEEIYLAPNDRARLDHDGNVCIDKVENTNDYLKWKNDYFTFNNKSLDEVLRIMSKYYNIKFKCDPFIGSMMLTINLSNMSLEDFLSMVDYALSITHDKVGNTIIFNQ